MSSWPEQVQIREVGPRDGLQGERAVTVADRAALIDVLTEAGIADVEAVAFVSPRLVPAMAGAADVLAQISRRPGVRYWALVPNMRGAEMALAAGIDGLSVTASASETYSDKNVGMSVAESVAELGRIAASAGGRTPVDAVISCAFGSPFEGDIAPAAVAALGRQLLAAGATTVTFADTTGMASPRRIAALLGETGTDVGLHLHDTRGTALVNAFAALQEGVGRFDCSIGGLGGSPFAPGAGGNLATEDLVHLLDDLGVCTGVDLTTLLAASRLVATLVGHAVPSRVAHALV
jgi:hydroxymethylglutaryl-CoA lyase